MNRNNDSVWALIAISFIVMLFILILIQTTSGNILGEAPNSVLGHVTVTIKAGYSDTKEEVVVVKGGTKEEMYGAIVIDESGVLRIKGENRFVIYNNGSWSKVRVETWVEPIVLENKEQPD